MIPIAHKILAAAAASTFLLLASVPPATAAVSAGVACPRDIESGCVRVVVTDSHDRCDASGCWIIHKATIVLPTATCFDFGATPQYNTPAGAHTRILTACNYVDTEQEHEVSWSSIAEYGAIVDFRLVAWPSVQFVNPATASWTHYADSSGHRIEPEFLNRLALLVSSNGEANHYQAPIGVDLPDG